MVVKVWDGMVVIVLAGMMVKVWDVIVVGMGCDGSNKGMDAMVVKVWMQ